MNVETHSHYTADCVCQCCNHHREYIRLKVKLKELIDQLEMIPLDKRVECLERAIKTYQAEQRKA